jgi:Fic family protein
MTNDRFYKRLDFTGETNRKITKLLNEINELKGSFKVQANLSPQLVDRLTQNVLITSTGASTRIEGSLLSDSDVKQLFKHKIQKFNSRDQQEVAGYIELLKIVFDSFDSIRLSENTIKQFHSILLKYSDKDTRHKGVYKFGNNRVEARNGEGNLIGVIFDPTPPHLVSLEMERLLQFTAKELEKQDFSPLIIIANFIFEFLAIHPFQDGNGRCSRVLTNLLLLQNDYDFTPFISHERIIEKNKEKYYQALNTTQRSWKSENEDITPWVLFFLEVVRIQATEAVRLLENKEDMELILSQKQLLVWNIISNSPEPLTRSEVQNQTNIALSTVRQSLRKLLDLNKIESIGTGRATRYRVI